MITAGAIHKIAMLGNHLPRQCGIATFTTDLTDAIAAEFSDLDCFVLAMNDAGRRHLYPDRVRFEIAESDVASYRRAAWATSRSPAATRSAPTATRSTCTTVRPTRASRSPGGAFESCSHGSTSMGRDRRRAGVRSFASRLDPMIGRGDAWSRPW